jgi:hypothetical protein
MEAERQFLAAVIASTAACICALILLVSGIFKGFFPFYVLVFVAIAFVVAFMTMFRAMERRAKIILDQRRQAEMDRGWPEFARKVTDPLCKAQNTIRDRK